MKAENKESLSNNRILIIESDPELRVSIKRLLRRRHFEVYTAQNYNDVQNCLDEISFNCIIFGLNQPLTDSVTQLKIILAHKQNPCTILISQYDWLEIEDEISQLDIAEFTTKPVKQETLINIIDKLKRQKL